MRLGSLAKSALAVPSVFELYQWAVGAPGCHRRFLDVFAQPVPGESLIDLGCGPGAALAHIAEGIRYVGVDINPDYINAARRRFPSRGVFLCADLMTADFSNFAPFDLAISFGVLHHLADAEARAVLELAHRIVRPGGRLVTMDPCYVQNQSRIARFLNDHDRGRYIRDAESYRQLFDFAGAVETKVVLDMLRIPYTMIAAAQHVGQSGLAHL